MNTVAIIQARMTSTRLPGKVLMKIAGKPMLWYVIKRTRLAKLINCVVVATSIDSTDNQIVDFCRIHKINYFRGSLDDVLSRYYHAARKYKADVIVRITADCPLVDGKLVDKGLKIFKRKKVDYLSNTIERTFPRGFDFEIFTKKTLIRMHKNAKDATEREHVTPYIYQSHPEDFSVLNLKNSANRSSFRITVDTKDDLKLIKILIEKYGADNKNFEWIISLLEKYPDLVVINQNVRNKLYGE